MQKDITVDDYLARLSADKRLALETLRAQIRRLAPQAEERIAYGIPSYYLKGRPVVHFGAGARHCAFYPGGIVDQFTEDLKGYETSRGTIRFQPGKPLPAAVVAKIVKAALARRQPAEPVFPKGVSRPAARALATIGVTTLDQCAQHSERELKSLHGLGPKALQAIKRALALKGKALKE